jgi:5S rRNA maturation endonuclease (ribonuclease M5)
VDNDQEGERLRQRMDDLLRDARALRALIEEASHAEASKSVRKPQDVTAPSSRAYDRRPSRG